MNVLKVVQYAFSSVCSFFIHNSHHPRTQLTLSTYTSYHYPSVLPALTHPPPTAADLALKCRIPRGWSGTNRIYCSIVSHARPPPETSFEHIFSPDLTKNLHSFDNDEKKLVPNWHAKFCANFAHARDTCSMLWLRARKCHFRGGHLTTCELTEKIFVSGAFNCH